MTSESPCALGPSRPAAGNGWWGQPLPLLACGCVLGWYVSGYGRHCNGLCFLLADEKLEESVTAGYCWLWAGVQA
jgi:hypothetical protein